MNMNLINEVTADQIKTNLPHITSGDTVRVTIRINEANKTRTQDFEGVVIKTQGHGINYSVLIRKANRDVYMERIFLLHSPLIEDVKIIKRGRVRRARIYYMRNRHGKAARIKEIIKNPNTKR